MHWLVELWWQRLANRPEALGLARWGIACLEWADSSFLTAFVELVLFPVSLALVELLLAVI